jgi:hypothetical protein
MKYCLSSVFESSIHLPDGSVIDYIKSDEKFKPDPVITTPEDTDDQNANTLDEFGFKK